MKLDDCKIKLIPEKRVISTRVPSIDDVRSVILNKIEWKLPQEVLKKISVVDKDEKEEEEETQSKKINTFINAYSIIHRIAFLCVAFNTAFEAPKISNTIIEVLNKLPNFVYKPSDDFSLSPFCLNPDGLNDDNFKDFLLSIFSDCSETEKKLLSLPYVTSSLALILSATIERISDYALICFVLQSEFNHSSLPSTDEFSREKAPQFVSIVAQRILDIALNSKNLRNNNGKSPYNLSEIPKYFAPIFQTVSSIRTSIAKPNHFYDDFLLSPYIHNYVYSTNKIQSLLSKKESMNETIEVTPYNCVQILAQCSYIVFQTFSPQVVESIEHKRLTVGTISKELSINVFKYGPSALMSLCYYSPPTGKKTLPKEPNGTRDLLPKQMKVREQVINLVTQIFKRHGAVSIDTPVFELRSVLTEKYGEESKLIYNLEDQGGELLSLRYDLTVPFARFVATHGINKIKRYHIAKVYRRDKPAIDRGRFREFYQCDFDIAGNTGLMIADAEVISIVSELLDSIGKLCELDDFEYTIRVSHRQLLSAISEVCGIPNEKFKTFCSSLDKLDKSPWEEVRRELIEVKGLDEICVNKVEQYVNIKGSPSEVLSSLRSIPEFVSKSSKTLNEMELLFNYLSHIGCLNRIIFDISLARGLDYYTGVIYEANASSGNVGSIAGGGRYDGLIGMFTGKEVPAVGVSLGIERVFTLIERLKGDKQVHESDTEVYIASIGGDYTNERFSLSSAFWHRNIPTEFFPKSKPDIRQQLSSAEQSGARVVILLAPDEMREGKVKIREIVQSQGQKVPIERIVPLSNVVDETIKLLNELKKLN